MPDEPGYDPDAKPLVTHVGEPGYHPSTQYERDIEKELELSLEKMESQEPLSDGPNWKWDQEARLDQRESSCTRYSSTRGYTFSLAASSSG